MKKSIFSIFLFSYALVPAQEFNNDAQVWLNLSVRKKITKNFSVQLSQQDRWANNVSQFELSYWDAGVIYKLTKGVALKGDYVLGMKKRNDGGYSIRHQYYIALFLKKEIQRWSVIYRNKLQLQYYDPYTSADGNNQYIYDRNKITVKYAATKRFEFFVAEELYLPLNNPQVTGFQRSRSYAGVCINTTKNQQLQFYFALQAQLQNGNWFKQSNSYDNSLLKHDYIYGVSYSFSFD